MSSSSLLTILQNRDIEPKSIVWASLKDVVEHDQNSDEMFVRVLVTRKPHLYKYMYIRVITLV